MFKPKTLLKVISVLMIILGVLGLIGTIIGLVTLPQMVEQLKASGMDTALIEQANSPLNIALSIVSVLAGILAGIFGVTGKSFRGALISMIVYTIIIIISYVQVVMQGAFTASNWISLALPILYWWGLYQSKE